MNWIKGIKGSLVNLDRIMSIITDYNEEIGKHEVKAFYDCIHCNTLAEFEHIDHAVVYVDCIFKLLQEKKCTLDTASSGQCSDTVDLSTSCSGQTDSSRTLVMLPNSPVAPDNSSNLIGTSNQT